MAAYPAQAHRARGDRRHLVARVSDHPVDQPSGSAFHGTRLREELDRLGVAHLVICGVSTHSCVAQTAIDGFAQDLHVAVACEAVASENPELSDALLRFLAEEMRQPLLDQARSLALLRDGWPPR
ncbi:isochorismatase family protein [Naumannella sp. ID2617S]|nr:isochorismatase family protein [Naumannella sp. ID2617S]